MLVPAAVSAGTLAPLTATLSSADGESSSGLILAVDPLLELVPSQPRLALASAGRNALSVQVGVAIVDSARDREQRGRRSGSN